jgi:hypothetical protein
MALSDHKVVQYYASQNHSSTLLQPNLWMCACVCKLERQEEGGGTDSAYVC